MLSQRYTKFALQYWRAKEVDQATASNGMQITQQAFEHALTRLNGIPLSTPAIHQTLSEAGVTWMELVAATKALTTAKGQPPAKVLQQLTQCSEDLLAQFNQLAAQYEHSLDMLMG